MRIANLSTKSGSMSSSDKFVTDNGTTVTKIDYNALAKAIIEQYTGSSLAGSAQSVKAALDALNSKTNVSTSITLSTNESGGTIRAYKVGNLGVVSYMGVSRSGHAADEVIMTFPTVFRPPLSWDFSINKATSSCTGRIKTNGEVSIWTTPPTGTGRLYFSTVFPLA